MILKSKDTTVAYRCPECGQSVIGIVGIFTLTGDLIKLKCGCGKSELTVVNTSDGKIRLTVPCLVCPKPHSYLLGSATFFDRELFTLSCSYSGIDLCFIGGKDAVRAALEESDRELEELISESGADDYDGDIPEDDGAKLFDETRLDDIVRFILCELRDEGHIRCKCDSPADAEYDFMVRGDKVIIYCSECGASTAVELNSTITANAFLHCDELTLE